MAKLKVKLRPFLYIYILKFSGHSDSTFKRSYYKRQIEEIIKAMIDAMFAVQKVKGEFKRQKKQ